MKGVFPLCYNNYNEKRERKRENDLSIYTKENIQETASVDITEVPRYFYERQVFVTGITRNNPDCVLNVMSRLRRWILPRTRERRDMKRK